MSTQKPDMFASDGLSKGALSQSTEQGNPALVGATKLYNMGGGLILPFEYGGVENEILGYRESAWIGTTLMLAGIYDIVGPDACKFLGSICVNDFSKLGNTGLRHAVICNDKGQVLTDGVVIRIAEDRYRTYWLNPPIQYLVEQSDLDVHGEDMTGTEYFIQVQGERSLEILEDAFQADLHDIKFAKHRTQDMDGREVRIIRLGMSGNLAYEIHGPMAEYEYVYGKVWASGEKFGARKLGMHAYNEFNHTEAGFPNIHLHYPLPWFESTDDMTAWMYANPMLSMYNINRKLAGSSQDLQERFVTPYDLGWGFLVKFNHEFTGREALEKIAESPQRTVATLEWDAEDVGRVFAAMNTRGGERVDDISALSDFDVQYNSFNGCCRYVANEVYAGDEKVGITSGRIHSYAYNSMISLAFIRPDLAAEGTELTVLWGTPGTKQMPVKARVARYPYNGDLVRNEDRDVSDVPARFA